MTDKQSKLVEHLLEDTGSTADSSAPDTAPENAPGVSIGRPLPGGEVLQPGGGKSPWAPEPDVAPDEEQG